MLTMRPEQVDAFRQHHLQKFEDEMVEHLQRSSPRHWKVIGDADGRRFIRLGIEQAKRYGFTNRAPIRFYIELMFMFGSYFDTDPQYSWAGTVLQDPDAIDQTVRADRLYDAMNKYLGEVSGPDYRYLIEALRRMSQLKIEDFLVPGMDPEDGILEKLRFVYPQKCEFLGESVLRVMIRNGFKLAHTYDLANDRGRVLMTGFAFAIGHGFPRDPLHGWVGRRLAKPKFPSAAERVDELYSKAILYLNRIQTLADDNRT